MALRIIGGELRGRRLETARGTGTRPTADRVREALFSIIAAAIPGANVLDLFAGSGALGIEALSRGAHRACFVDISRRAVAVLRRNLEACGLAARTRVIRWDISRNLNCLQAASPQFDLVLLDPPYGRGLVTCALEHLHAAGCLQPAARVVAEHAADEPITDPPVPYRLADRRRYGKTLVSFLDYML